MCALPLFAWFLLPCFCLPPPSRKPPRCTARFRIPAARSSPALPSPHWRRRSPFRQNPAPTAIRFPLPRSRLLHRLRHRQGLRPAHHSECHSHRRPGKELNLPLAIAVEQQEVTVNGETQGVSISPDQNASAMVIKGSDLDALSDDPTELQNELQALAGPAAGPNGGQIYIDGFEGGQIPPKSAILEIRVNQNPFSAEYDRIGYGRIEIITKPGSQKFQGSIGGFGNSSALNTGNPSPHAASPATTLRLLGTTSAAPSPKPPSYFFNAFTSHRQNQSIVDALNPATLTRNIIEAFPAPMEYFFTLNPRVDFQLTKNNFISIRDSFTATPRREAAWARLACLNRPPAPSTATNELQIGDTWVINPHLLMEPRFLWRRISNNSDAQFLHSHGHRSGRIHQRRQQRRHAQDHQDIFMLQDYGTATVGPHTLRFGARARSYRDANYSTSGANGSYFFNCALTPQCADLPGPERPTQYSATVINNPAGPRASLRRLALSQDDWRVNKSFLLGLGLRYEGQNFIHDHADWAPRIAFAWTPGHPGKTPPKTVIRGGYGWFYNRFIVPTAFNGAGGTPYIIAGHPRQSHQSEKLHRHQSQSFYNPNAAEPRRPRSRSTASSIPTYHSVDPHFHAALDMQGGIGVDRQIGKHVTSQHHLSLHAGRAPILDQQCHRARLRRSPTTPSPDPRPGSTTTSSSPAAFTGKISSSSPRALQLKTLSR